MKLQISSRLAVFAVLELARNPDKQLSVAEIGQKYGASAHHLAKVMNVLGRAGLVESSRGVGGGYRFAGNARRVTLLDIIELFEDVSSIRPEQNEPSDRTDVGRVLQAILTEIDDITNATFGSITISTMLKLMDRAGKPVDRREPLPAAAQPRSRR